VLCPACMSDGVCFNVYIIIFGCVIICISSVCIFVYVYSMYVYTCKRTYA